MGSFLPDHRHNAVRRHGLERLDRIDNRAAMDQTGAAAVATLDGMVALVTEMTTPADVAALAKFLASSGVQ